MMVSVTLDSMGSLVATVHRFPLPSPTILTAVLGIFLILVFMTYFQWQGQSNNHGNRAINAPIVGYTNMALARYQFLCNGPALIREGYNKYKYTFFKVSGHDLLIVPRKYLSELASMPSEMLSPNAAFQDSFQRLPSITSVFTDHSLQSRMVATRLSPKISVHIPKVQQQLDKYLPVELPAIKANWTSVNALQMARRIVHRSVAARFVTELAEDEDYLSTAISYTENAFKHSLFLRVFHDWAKGFVACFLPTGWAVDAALKKATRMIIPIIRNRNQHELESDSCEKPDDFLQYLIEGGKKLQDSEAVTVQRLMATNLAIPATMVAVAQVLFDLCVHPQYMDPLRQEILDVIGKKGFTQQALTDLKKLDSFMRESQRLSPPTLRKFHPDIMKSQTSNPSNIMVS